MRYRITLRTVPYFPASAPESKTVRVIIEQDFEDMTQACREADMYNNAPFFGQRLVVDQVETVNE